MWWWVLVLLLYSRESAACLNFGGRFSGRASVSVVAHCSLTAWAST